MQEILDAAQESTDISAKAITFLAGTTLLGLFALDAVIVAPDDTNMPFPINYADEVLLLASGLLLIHQSEAIGEIQKLVL